MKAAQAFSEFLIAMVSLHVCSGFLQGKNPLRRCGLTPAIGKLRQGVSVIWPKLA
jgi:hypothetical protein